MKKKHLIYLAILLGIAGFSFNTLERKITKTAIEMVNKPFFDPDARRYINAMSPKPSEKFQIAINNFFVYLKDNGEYWKYDYALFMATESQSHSLINMFNPTVIATAVNNPTWTPNICWAGDSATQYINLNYNPQGHGASFTKGNNGISTYVIDNNANFSAETGVYNGTQGNWMASEWTDNKQYARTGSTSAGALNNNSIGLNSYIYDGTNVKQYINGTLIGTTAIATNIIPNINAYALGLNNSGSLYLGSKKRMSFISYHKGDANPAILYTALTKLFKDLNTVPVVNGWGDSFMLGTNASTQDSSWFNRLCKFKGWTCINNGVAGQAITCGGSQACFNFSNIPIKQNINDKLIIDWTLNDVLMTYSSTPTRSLSQVSQTINNFLCTALTTYSYYPCDVMWVTGWRVGNTNAFYTQAQVDTVTNRISAMCSTYGVTCAKSFTFYPVANDSVHPKDDASYRNIFNQLKTKL